MPLKSAPSTTRSWPAARVSLLPSIQWRCFASTRSACAQRSNKTAGEADKLVFPRKFGVARSGTMASHQNNGKANPEANPATNHTLRLKVGLAEMLKGGVIMDVINAEQAEIAEKAGAVAVMALERVPAQIRAEGGVARMASPAIIKELS